MTGVTTAPIFPYLIDPIRGESIIARFWNHVDRAGPKECWDWTGSRRGKGLYGQFGLCKGQLRRANRVAWTIANNRDPGGMVIRHTCDRPVCCNPAHLIEGTPEDNVNDMVIRRRSWAKPPAESGVITVASLQRDNERLRSALMKIAAGDIDCTADDLRALACSAIDIDQPNLSVTAEIAA